MIALIPWELVGHILAITTAFAGAVVAVTITRAKLEDLQGHMNELTSRISDMEAQGSSKTRENYAILANSLTSHDIRITKLESIIPQVAAMAVDVSWIKREMERKRTDRQ